MQVQLYKVQSLGMVNIAITVFLAFIVRLLIYPLGTYQLDHNTFIAWGRLLHQVGFSSFYQNTWSDYLPGYLYVLRFLAIIEANFKLDSTLLYKLPAILGDLATGLVIYKISLKKFDKKIALFTASIFLFNPAIFANSTLWGQVDIFTVLFALLSLYFIEEKPTVSAVFLGLGALIKPQIAVVAPILFAINLADRWDWMSIVKYWSTFATVLIFGFIPFKGFSGGAVEFITSRISVTLNQYQYGSVNAFNFWGLFGFWKPDNQGLINSKLIGGIIMIVSSLLVFVKVSRKQADKYLALAVLFVINFMFMTRMHERHFLPAVAALSIYSIESPLLLIVYSLFSITYLDNLYYAYKWVDMNRSFSPVGMTAIPMILTNLIGFVLLLVVFLKKEKALIKKVKEYLVRDIVGEKLKDRFSKKTAGRLLKVILIFSLAIRVFNLWYPPNDYFDEIYHAFTARQILKSDKLVWDWIGGAPDGFAYEWTHPPLAKEIMAASMKIFGVNSFAWRLPGAILGVLIIYLTYKLAFAFTKSRDVAIFSAIFLSLDGLTLTMSRIGTADVYILFFALLSMYLMTKEMYVASSLALGLSLASKWSAVWLIPVMIVLFIGMVRKIKPSLISFLFIPPLVYLASYIPMFSFGFDLKHFIGMQQQMWWYHTHLDATHPYQSRWWTWPIMRRPVYLFQYISPNRQIVGDIYAIGNPVVFWFGILAAVLTVVYLIKVFRNREKFNMGIVLFAYLMFFVPWAMSPRIMFIYHYLPSLPFLAIMAGFILKKSRRLVLPILSLALICFVYFYPHWIGLHIPKWLADSYYWFSSWR